MSFSVTERYCCSGYDECITDTNRTCNNGMITGRVVQIDEASGTYTSQLSITVSSELIGKNVSCVQDAGTAIELIGSATIILTTTGICKIQCSYFTFLYIK